MSSRTCCPACDSESVGWYGTRCTCKTCQRMTFNSHTPCIWCGGKDIEVIYGKATCGDCGWEGDPYDLIEWPDGEDEEETA